MRRIYPQTDAIIEVVVYDDKGNEIPLNQVTYLNIRLYTHMFINGLTFYKEDIDEEGNLCVPSQQLSKLPSGVLKYHYQVSFTDPRFPDETYDYSDVLQTDCYLVNALPCCGRPGPQFSDQYVTKLWLAKNHLIDASTEPFVTEFELAEAISEIEKLPAYQGTQGFQGTQGEQGVQGFPGAQGVDGLPGPDGQPGEQGPMGTQGYQGTQGLAGADGQPGRDGNPGVDGQPGQQGPIGTQGYQGTQGLEGPQGPMGTPGIEGTRGEQGTQGFYGTQGFQGTQGEKGAQGEPGPSTTVLENLTSLKVTGPEEPFKIEWDSDEGYAIQAIDSGKNRTGAYDFPTGKSGTLALTSDFAARDASIAELASILEEDEETIAESFIGVNGRLDKHDSSLNELYTIINEDEEVLAQTVSGINSHFTAVDASIAQLFDIINSMQ